MSIRKLIQLTENALVDAYNFESDSDFDSQRLKETQIVLELLLQDLKHNNKINERVLRGMSDLGVYAFKCFENTDLESSINELNNELWNEISTFRGIPPLGDDFGKGDPI